MDRRKITFPLRFESIVTFLEGEVPIVVRARPSV